jgi:oligoendopeptidase F
LLSEPVTYMLQNRLYDVTDSGVKMDSSFTTYISDYRAPFIFSDWTGYADNIATILHELGHFTNYYHNAVVGYSAVDSLDLAEVDAQALVLLLFDDYESFYGDLADEARTAALIDAMYSLLSGCMEDEFQQDVYENPNMTLEQMNTLYGKLAEEYGLQQVYGYQGTEWVLITHTFQTPMYYISYAASMVPALELFQLAQNDPESAKNAYFHIIMRESYESLGDVLAQNGLAPVFAEDTIAHIADILISYTT